MQYIDMGYLIYHYAKYPDNWYDVKFRYSKYMGVSLCSENPISYRKQKYPWYKEHRARKKSEYTRLANELWAKVSLDCSLNIESYEGYEGDDIIAYHAIKNPSASFMGVDKDFMQLPSINLRNIYGDTISLNTVKKPKTIEDILNDGYLWLYHLCLYGDSSDNIPRLVPYGIRGIRQEREMILQDNRWDIALNMYGEDLLHNLWLAVLPNPYILGDIPEIEVFELVKKGLWYDEVRRYGKLC